MKAAEILESSLVYLGLGSNLGDRKAQIEAAISLLSAHPQIQLIAKSTLIENPPIGEAGPYVFLNAVISIETNLEPLSLLRVMQGIEHSLDPERNERGRKLARKIDIDILLFGDRVISSPELSIPHPRMYERDFVLKPLAEIAPELVCDLQQVA